MKHFIKKLFYYTIIVLISIFILGFINNSLKEYISSVDTNSLVIILLTAVLTSICSLFSQLILENNSRNNQKALIKKNILRVIISDIKAIKKLFYKRIDDLGPYNPGTTIAEANYDFVYFPIRSNYFTVFDNNAANLGYLNNQQLQENTILTYAELKGLLDSLISLEETSKEAISLLGNNDNTSIKRLNISQFNHSQYAQQILTDQLPSVITKMNNLEKALSNELSNMELSTFSIIKNSLKSLYTFLKNILIRLKNKIS